MGVVRHTGAVTIEPDTKDWTWVLSEPCPECGFDPAAVAAADLADLIRENTRGWHGALDGPDAAVRPVPTVWSPLEYACHVRDVHRLFAERLTLMLTHDDPQFANWDQDVTAIESRYAEQDPATVAVELVEAAAEVAADLRPRRGRPVAAARSSQQRVGVHRGDPRRLPPARRAPSPPRHRPMTDPRDATIAAYQADAAAYAGGTADTPESVVRDLDDFAERVGSGGHVLEIGSGAGRDARELERRGLTVRRTDITPAFVDLMRADGFDADVLDPLVDDLGGPWDGVWANAVLLHLGRDEMPLVLARLAAATRPGGVLHLSVKEGDGEAWSTHGHVSAARHFTYWREQPLRVALAGAGWEVAELRHTEGTRELWLDVFAHRRDGTTS